jgi:hypothetical protein
MCCKVQWQKQLSMKTSQEAFWRQGSGGGLGGSGDSWTGPGLLCCIPQEVAGITLLLKPSTAGCPQAHTQYTF